MAQIIDQNVENRPEESAAPSNSTGHSGDGSGPQAAPASLYIDRSSRPCAGGEGWPTDSWNNWPIAPAFISRPPGTGATMLRPCARIRKSSVSISPPAHRGPRNGALRRTRRLPSNGACRPSVETAPSAAANNSIARARHRHARHSRYPRVPSPYSSHGSASRALRPDWRVLISLTTPASS
jgi:hypothetical protein